MLRLLTAGSGTERTLLAAATDVCVSRDSGLTRTSPLGRFLTHLGHATNLFDHRVGFIVTNLSRPAERVVGFCNELGTWKRRIKKGKDAIKWTPLSCRTFEVNAVRLSCGKAGNAQIFKPVRAALSEWRHQGGQPC